MKKYALVFYGLIGYSDSGGRGYSLNPKYSYQTFRKHILEPNNYNVINIYNENNISKIKSN